MATPRLGLVVEDKPTELSCSTSGDHNLILHHAIVIFLQRIEWKTYYDISV